MASKPYPKSALPSLTYSETLTLHFNDEEIEVVHYAAGHTDGDSVIFFRNANVVHMGDPFFLGMFPFIDVGTGGNVLGLADNVKRVLSVIDDKTQVIPGHGALSTKDGLRDFYQMLVETTAEVKAMKDKGSPIWGNHRRHLVGVRGFEPPTPSSRTTCATRLRHTPKSINTGTIAAYPLLECNGV